MAHLCYFCLVFVTFLCLFIAALWSPAGKKANLLVLVCGVKLCSCCFPMWYSWSGVVLDCIDS